MMVIKFSIKQERIIFALRNAMKSSIGWEARTHFLRAARAQHLRAFILIEGTTENGCTDKQRMTMVHIKI